MDFAQSPVVTLSDQDADTRANEIMADKTAENKLPSVQESFAKEFQFTDLGTSMRVGLKATIN